MIVASAPLHGERNLREEDNVGAFHKLFRATREILQSQMCGFKKMQRFCEFR